MPKKTKKEAAAVLAPKVYGAVHLDQATGDEKLDFFALFSSLSSVLGNVGQTDYAFANGFMDRFAEKRASLLKSGERFGKTISINWPLWEEGGMRVDQQTREWMRRSAGLEVLPTETGLEIFVKGLSFNKSGFMPLSVHDSDTLLRKMSLSALPPQSAASPGKESKKPADGLVGQLKEKLALMAADILKTEPEEIDFDEELQEYGFDSITFVELMNRSATDFRLDLTPDVLMENPTINQFASYLLDNYPEQIESALF